MTKQFTFVLCQKIITSWSRKVKNGKLRIPDKVSYLTVHIAEEIVLGLYREEALEENQTEETLSIMVFSTYFRLGL